MYRLSVDAVVAWVNWTLDTEEDVRLWVQEYHLYFGGRFGRKVDLILELSNFQVNPRVGALFGKKRAEILAEYTARSYRVKQGARVRTFMYTSSVLHGAPANEYPSIEGAIAALIAAREADARAHGK
jgi:hypothetical protein